ncbi:MAG: STAS domain-containing protein [Bacteroidia bacterium]|nr:STAS domain-containing protein [Bacteroidia bacterium]
MDIKIRKSGEIRIVHFSGRLDTRTSPDAEFAIDTLLVAGHDKIIINLADTEWISSSGLRVLLVIAKKLSAKSGKLKICQPNEVVKEILDISGFSTILDVCISEVVALSEF